MTVFSAELPSYSHYYVNDVININDKFNISFPFLEEPQYVRVYLITDEGKAQDLDLGVHYKVVLSNGISNVWGQVQILSLIESVKGIYIVRNIKNDQNQAFNSQTIFANTVERAFDKLTMLNQDILLNEIEKFVHVAYNEPKNIRALQLPLANQRANTTLQFDKNGAILCQKSWDERKSIHAQSNEKLDNKLQLPLATERANTTLQFDENGAILCQKSWDERKSIHAQSNEKLDNKLQLPLATERANTTLQFDENGAILCRTSWDERKSIHAPYNEKLDNKLELPSATERANTTLQFDENGAIKLIKNTSGSFLYVSAKKGNDFNNGLSPNTPKKSIQLAISAVLQMQSSHMIDIFVEGDEYEENLIIMTGVNIHADNATLIGSISIMSYSILNFNKIIGRKTPNPSNGEISIICDAAEINIKYVEDVESNNFIEVSGFNCITKLTVNLGYVNLKNTLICLNHHGDSIDHSFGADVNININNLNVDNTSFMFINSNNTEDHASNCINLYIKRCSISNIAKSFLVNLLNLDNYIVIRCEQFLAQVRELNVNVIGALYMNLGLVDGDYTLTNHTENAKVYLDYVYDANK